MKIRLTPSFLNSDNTTGKEHGLSEKESTYVSNALDMLDNALAERDHTDEDGVIHTHCKC